MRYIPHTETEVVEMLRVVGKKSVDDLFDSIPENLRLKEKLHLSPAASEIDLMKHMQKQATKNVSDAQSFLGAGAYRHHVPAAVNSLAMRAEFITPYTPYQPELSQGTLQTIFEYQTMITRLFGMDISNASHYDGSTATAEAALIATKITKRNKIIVADTLHPEYIETIKTILSPSEISIALVGHTDNGTIDREELAKLAKHDVACLIVGYPNFFGIIDDLRDLAETIHKAEGLFITSTPEPMSLGLIEAPGNLSADIACAEGQSFGGGLNFGGPYLGIFTVKEKYLRSMPGRVVGETVDTDGAKSYVLTFSTREQHIRREKATSNICSNQALCATRAAIYLSLIGKEGLTNLAKINYERSEYAKDVFRRSGFGIHFKGHTFNEFVVDLGKSAEEVVLKLLKKGFFGGVALGKWFPDYKNCMLVCVTEENSKKDIDKYVSTLTKIINE